MKIDIFNCSAPSGAFFVAFIAVQGEISNQTVEAETQTQQDSAELLKDRKDNDTIENKHVTIAKSKIDYRKIFFEKYPETEGEVVVHHAIEQQVLKYFEDVGFTKEEINSIENLRGIPKELDNNLHKSIIRREWSKFYKNNPNPTKEQFIEKMMDIDEKYGELFNPPITKKGYK